MKEESTFQSERLLSLDFFRGITIFLLVAEGTELWSVLIQSPIAGSFPDRADYISVHPGTRMVHALLFIPKANLFQDLNCYTFYQIN